MGWWFTRNTSSNSAKHSRACHQAAPTCSAAVSYTHLDVYKRQPMKRAVSSYVPLRVHSHYSFLDSTLSPTAIVELAKRHGLSSVALTDTGNLHGACLLYTSMAWMNQTGQKTSRC